MSEYIEREVLKENILSNKLMAREPATNRILQMIEDAPTADVQEVRHGKWLEDDYGYCHCSNCRYEHDSPECITPYCPECGAKMDEE